MFFYLIDVSDRNFSNIKLVFLSECLSITCQHTSFTRLFTYFTLSLWPPSRRLERTPSPLRSLLDGSLDPDLSTQYYEVPFSHLPNSLVSIVVRVFLLQPFIRPCLLCYIVFFYHSSIHQPDIWQSIIHKVVPCVRHHTFYFTFSTSGLRPTTLSSGHLLLLSYEKSHHCFSSSIEILRDFSVVVSCFLSYVGTVKVPNIKPFWPSSSFFLSSLMNSRGWFVVVSGLTLKSVCS